MIRYFILLLIIPFNSAFLQENNATVVFEKCIDKVGLVDDGYRTIASGFFINSNTFITNNHVVENLYKNRIFVRLKNGKEYTATVLATKPSKDLAVLKVNGTADYLKIIDPDEIKQGDKVYALGNAATVDSKLFEFNITEGIVNNIKHETFTGKNMHINAEVILHSASINPGNSGGPLVTSNGAVAGVNSFYYTVGNNLYFAIHTSELIDFLKENNIKFYYTSKLNKIVDNSNDDNSIFNSFVIIAIVIFIFISGIIIFLLINNRKKNIVKIQPHSFAQPSQENIQQQNQEQQFNKPFHKYENHLTGTAFLIYKGRKNTINKNFYLVGRDINCNLILDDITASRQHFAIILQNNNFVLKDLNSKNGTYLNGLRIQSSILKNGDIIKVGSSSIIFNK